MSKGGDEVNEIAKDLAVEIAKKAGRSIFRAIGDRLSRVHPRGIVRWLRGFNGGKPIL